MTFGIPDKLQQVSTYPGGEVWLQKLPDLLNQCISQWNLTDIGDAFTGSNVSLALPAKQNAEYVVLKIQYPDPSSLYEADALKEWCGDGSIRLLNHDRENSALLLERCLPGSYLADNADTDPLEAVVSILPRLWRTSDVPFTTLSNQAREWAKDIPIEWKMTGRPCERYLVDAALDYIKVLSDSQPEQVLLHQDMHGHNIISAEREPWLAIDPKPLIGEKAFSLAPIVRSFELGQTKSATRYRLDRLSDELGVDRERARGWTVAQSMAWSFCDGGHVRHESVRWLLDQTN